MATILIGNERALKRGSLELLGYHGHRLLQFADGEKVLEVVRTEKPDLVLIDILMPEPGGFDGNHRKAVDVTQRLVTVAQRADQQLVLDQAPQRTLRPAESCCISIWRSGVAVRLPTAAARNEDLGRRPIGLSPIHHRRQLPALSLALEYAKPRKRQHFLTALCTQLTILSHACQPASAPGGS